MNPLEQLERLLKFLQAEASANPAFAHRLEEAWRVRDSRAKSNPSRRATPSFDPFNVFDNQGERQLSLELESLSVEQLKDIIAHHGMDTAKLAMKWKTADRLIALILDRVRQRSSKGDAFRA